MLGSSRTSLDGTDTSRNKLQVQAQLALLPLTQAVDVEEGVDEDNVPRVYFTFGNVEVSIHAQHTDLQLRDLVANLPLTTQDRLAALAILLLPTAGQGV